MNLIQQIYNKKIEGDPITDVEVIDGIKFFKKLADQLVICGPVFRLAFKEANDTYLTLLSYAHARQLKVPKKYR